MKAPKDLIEVGKIGKPVGLKGNVLLWLNDPSSDVLEHHDKLWVGDRWLTVEVVRPKADAWEVGFAEIAHRDGAVALTHAVVSVPRAALSEDEFYVEDLRGRRVIDENGVERGVVSDIVWAGPRAMLEVSGKLVPVDGPFIVRVAPDVVTISAMSGLFD